ncbi:MULTISPECIES: methionyl-tRNA formyltransferase [Petrotoga]|uniref:Methionyl-tRNA formyltransferase n=2 Tax=Petrotoga sibirica TaxID=156202 RepID=A0A4R8EZA9_9BACT|nr:MULTISPECIES: methionyl-tRNA formyltransferase [Petrotoga]KUK83848.1 MAG: Methionyl-tRNA formyltransferase [Petrotoga mobilis]POZ89507.1 methionyl-tRNA formyltransferase [Petrotoga sibirica DSM 13575]POZ91849.1 methionyl-tRNA formyltransferase [Petrotoga sp. SL27]TDX16198.1 methionyl-tRNA formyltransferase [Petrotoga sibirica]
MTTNNDFKIVFMGTPDFGAEVLEELINHNFNVVGVFSQPDRPRGRGKKLQPTPAKEIALKYNIPIFQPKSVNKGEGFDFLKELNPDIIITAAFGKILRKNVLKLPQKGCWNVHASLLPKYRGAAPIQRAIENGEKETGISIFKMVEALDAGDIAIQKSIPIEINDNYGVVYEKLLALAKETVLEFLNSFDRLILKPQNEEEASYAEKITKEDLIVDFDNDTLKVHNKIRAYDPYPGVRSIYEKEEVKMFGSEFSVDLTTIENKEEPGTIIDIEKDGIIVKCRNGAVKVKEIQFPGKKKITTIDAINGKKLKLLGQFRPY